MSARFLDRQSYIEIGNFFKKHRIKANITQSEIAKKLKVTPQFVSNSERGAGSFPPSAIKIMISKYKISHVEFYKFMDQIQHKSLRRLFNKGKENAG